MIDAPKPVTTEMLDVAQFGRVLHQRPASTDAPTAELIARLQARKAFGLNGGSWMMLAEPDPDCQEAADALAALAQEVERLKAAEARVREEQEIAAINLAAIEAATIERCAMVGDEWGRGYGVGREIAIHIRALSKEPAT
jgi:hypothetical protein